MSMKQEETHVIEIAAGKLQIKDQLKSYGDRGQAL